MIPDPARMLEGLTDAQREAASHLDGPALVLAGPGSGKTRVITRRIAHLVAQGVPAWSILALTFTNKAAGEMRARVDAIVPASVPGRRGLTVTTFHALGARLLRRYASAAGLPESFTIYDTGDQRDAVKQAIKDAGLDTKNFAPAAVHAHISQAKNNLLDAAAFAQHAGDFFSRAVAKAYKNYEAILKKAGALDFDDLLMRLAMLLRADERVRDDLQERYQYLLIDEYQDTNHVQFIIAHTLAARSRNIFVVGDPDQSIYGWRGADIRNILDFETHYPDARVIPLGQNFRSTAHIVAAADGLIRHNRRRKHKDLHTELEAGEKPRLVRCADEHHEARLVADELKRRHESGIAWKDMAVMYRVNALSRVMEDVLRREGVPYVIARGTAFYERQEVKDALAYLRLLANPADDVSFRRIVNTPTRGAGKAGLEKLGLYAINRNLTLLEAARQAQRVEGLSSKAVKGFTSFAAMVDGWRARLEGVSPPMNGGDRESPQIDTDREDVDSDIFSPLPLGEGPGARVSPVPSSLLPGQPITDLRQVVELVLRESGLEHMYEQQRTEEDQDRLENLAELVSSAADFVPPLELGAEPSMLQTLHAYLESVALVSDADMVDPANGAVTLLTLHAAKGLEFKAVCMIGLEEGLLPHANAADGEHGLEEERRLCFVGITRAERHLLLTCANVRTHRGLRERTIPSMSLREIPPTHLTMLDASHETDDDEPGGLRYVRDEGESAHETLVESKSGGRGGAFSGGAFPVGSMVRHPQFGVGRVESIERHSSHTRARIAFAAVGRKTLILEYARLERLSG